MGTNYYAVVDRCHECGHPELHLHLGKASAGWKFLGRAYKTQDLEWEDREEKPWASLQELETWLLLVEAEIEDEYCGKLSVAGFLDMVRGRQQGGRGSVHVDPEVFADQEGYEFLAREFS